MKRIFAVAIVAANLAFTASAARAEGNGYHQPFYPASSKTIQTVPPAATAVGTVTGPGFSPCAYCAFREDNMGVRDGIPHVTLGRVSGDQDPDRTWFPRDRTSLLGERNPVSQQSMRAPRSQLFFAADCFEMGS